jgi:hypothetical protein
LLMLMMLLVVVLRYELLLWLAPVGLPRRQHTPVCHGDGDSIRVRGCSAVRARGPPLARREREGRGGGRRRRSGFVTGGSRVE